jgi:protein tyrosine phosphatase (PTP) superfamily phosphohydrolase (DUF442 family)
MTAFSAANGRCGAFTLASTDGPSSGQGIVRKRTKLGWAVLLAFLLIPGCGGGSSQPETPASSEPAKVELGKVEAAGLHNVFRLSEKLYSGSSPDSDEGFASLKRLGVRTVISVDGARPDVERAHKYGLRYVHLPIGYDGVPHDQGLRIARAVRDLPGAVYVHCHHGKHRGPTAAAVAHLCLDERCGVDEALAEMKRAGTDPHYTGLYAAPAEFGRPTDAELDRVPDDFPEVSPVGGLASAMVEIDGRWDRLKAVRAAGWKSPPDQPDVDPPHEALLLVEGFREAARLPKMGERPERLRRWLGEAEAQAKDLETALRRGTSDGEAAEAAFKKVSASCTRCHADYRDTHGKRRRPLTAVEAGMGRR